MTGSGLGEGHRMLYMRPAAAELWTDLDTSLKNKKSATLQGPPGCGKSSVAWAQANQKASDNNPILWIHFSRKPSITICKMSSNLHSAVVDESEMVQLLGNFKGSQVIVDGYTKNILDRFGFTFSAWSGGKEGRSIFYVSSEQIRWAGEDLPGFERFWLDGWTLEEYQEACKNEDFFETVKNKLQESSSTSASTTGAANDEMMDDEPSFSLSSSSSSSSASANPGSSSNDEKNEMILTKFFIAGHSARWMFHFNTTEAIKDADNWLTMPENKQNIMNGMQGYNSNLAVNHLFTKVDRKVFLVSEYVTRSLMWDCDVEIMKSLTTLSSNLNNPAFDGWVFELDFLLQVRLHCNRKDDFSLFNDDNESVCWTCGSGIVRFTEVDELNGETIADGTWLIPNKWNQGGYDAAQLVGETLRFVQITRATSHSLNCKFLNELEEAVVACGKNVSKTEVAIVYPIGGKFNTLHPTNKKCLKRKLEEGNIATVSFRRIGQI